MGKKIAVLLAPGFEEVEAITPIDFLRRAEIETLVVGVGGTSITGAHGITLITDIEVHDLGTGFDGVVIPGGMPGASNLAASEDVSRFITRLFKEGGLVASICASPAVVLSGLNILEGREVTCYPGFENRLKSGNFVEERVVRDGNLITSRGPGTAAEFAVAIIEYLAGQSAAEKVYSSTLQR